MTELKGRYQGLHTLRFPSNPREKKISEVWQEYNEGCSCEPPQDSQTLLATLLKETPTKRDFLVAATVIQWLASPVGEGFLAEVDSSDRKG